MTHRAGAHPIGGLETGKADSNLQLRTGDEREPAPALDQNISTIARWEQAALHNRSALERCAGWITETAGSGPVIVIHVAWFAAWIVLNAGIVPGIAPFDRFPFPLLTMTVSLEAIFLTLFVLGSQNRLSQQADKRAHLDLQIDLLAEQEMTLVLRLLDDIARGLNIKTTVTTEQRRDLLKKTDIHGLANKLEDIPVGMTSGPQRR